MINCMKVKPKEGQAEALFKAFAEYALIGVHHSVESFMAIVNRENRVSEMMREYVEYYDDGEAFHSFSGPVVNHKDYL